MRQETSYIVIHCSQTRPSQNIGAKEIDRWHRERGWLKIGYHIVIKRDGIIEQGREDDEVPAAVKGYNHTSFNLCLVGGAKEENWKIEDDNFTLIRKHVIAVCEEIIIRKIKIDWCLPNGVRIDKLDPEMLRLMKKSGCYQMSLGIESANQRILDLIKKRLNKDC